jgi:type VI secretion system protein ImpI
MRSPEINLALEIVSANGDRLGSRRRKVFGAQGGRIGRALDCDWIIDDPYISRHHATVQCIAGTYYIESVGGNGIALNSREGLIPALERRALKSGDRVFLDEYEILVAAQASSVEVGAAAMRPAPRLIPTELSSIAETVDSPVLYARESPADELDPLKHLADAMPVRSTTPWSGLEWNHTSALSDQFSPPGVKAQIADIPIDWDKTTRGAAKAAAAATVLQKPSGEPAAVPRAAARKVADRPTSRSTDAGAPAAPVSQPTPAGALDLASFLKAAGIDPANLGPDTAANLGGILRCVVQGVVDVLRARAETKEEFRVTRTLVKPAENNPLKFAATGEEALNLLFGRRNGAYLSPTEAFADAFDDLRSHQLATLAGMRAGFDHLLTRLEPQALQQRAEAKGAVVPLRVLRQSRCWDLYLEQFATFAADRGQAFRRLFAEEFALAYQKQLESHKHSQQQR